MRAGMKPLLRRNWFMLKNQFPANDRSVAVVESESSMVGASKILTVSYGTFSCTLEGFDEPFSTMKAIAEYFRDLAADDRYFGAEPPTPDAEMLHRIAEREIHRRVEARIEPNGITLRPRDTAPAVAAAVPMPAAAPDSPTPAAELPVELPAAPPVEPAAMPDLAAPPADSVAAKLARIRAAVASARGAAMLPAADIAATDDSEAENAAIPAEDFGFDLGFDDIISDVAAQQPGESALPAGEAITWASAPPEPGSPAADDHAEDAADLVGDGDDSLHRHAAKRVSRTAATLAALTQTVQLLDEAPEAEPQLPGAAGKVAAAGAGTEPEFEAETAVDAIAEAMAPAPTAAPVLEIEAEPAPGASDADLPAAAAAADFAAPEPAVAAGPAAQSAADAEAEVPADPALPDAEAPQPETAAVTEAGEVETEVAPQPQTLTEVEAEPEAASEPEAIVTPAADATAPQTGVEVGAEVAPVPEAGIKAEPQATHEAQTLDRDEPALQTAADAQPDAAPALHAKTEPDAVATESEPQIVATEAAELAEPDATIPNPSAKPDAPSEGAATREPAGIRARVIKVRRAASEPATAAPHAATPEEAVPLADITAPEAAAFDDDSIEAAPHAATPEEAAPLADIAAPEAGAFDDDSIEAALRADAEAEAEAEASREPASADHGIHPEAARLELSEEAEAELARELAALETEPDPGDAAAATLPAKRTTPAPALPALPARHTRETAAAPAEADLTRLISETNTQLDVPENRRRFSAIAHLKAAVAATVAERKLRSDAPDLAALAEARDLERYREDLTRAVRPRRPAISGEPATRRPAAPEQRQPPLVLVSEQRIDRPRSAVPHDAPVIRPRRVSLGRAAAAAANIAEDEDDLDAAPLSPTEARNFAEFAESLGALELSELLEAAAAYTANVEGRPHFSRPQIIRKVSSLAEDAGYDREAGLRSFGMLLRQGKIAKVKRGQFAITEASRFYVAANRGR